VIAQIVRFAIRFPGLVVTGATLLALSGAYVVYNANLDVFPEFAPNLVVIQTEALGLPAELVETQVTQPIESALAGVNGVESMRSQSIAGLSVVQLTFAEDTNVFRNRQVVGERISLVSAQLPQGAGPPNLTPLTTSSSTVLGLGLTSSERSLLDMRTLVDTALRPHLLSVPGVADVNVFGGEVRQFQIQVDPEKLTRHGLSIAEVLAAARTATGVRGAGFIENANQRIVIAAEGQPLDPRLLGRTPLLHRNGVTLAIDDVAEVKLAPAPSISAAAIDGVPGVFMLVQGQYGASVRAVTYALEAALKEIAPLLERERVVLHPKLFRPANFIETAVGNVGHDVLLGAILVVGVLFVFLFSARTALISAVAIPASLLTALLILGAAGFSLNIMVLAGLAIALGEVVDDAIVDMENIYRRLRENRAAPNPLLPQRVVLDASLEVRTSVVYPTFIVVLVFYPLLTLSGVAGKLFAPLGIAYITAILASLLVALTLTPALCLLLLSRYRLKSEDPPLIRWLTPRYRSLLAAVETHHGIVIAVVVALLGVGIAALPLLSGQFIPPLKEGHYIIHMTAAPGTSAAESLRIGQRVARAVGGVQGVQSVAQWVGRAPNGADTAGVHYSEFEVETGALPGGEQDRLLRDLRQVLAGEASGFPGVVFSVNSFLVERIDETISGYTAEMVINVFGPSLEQLDRDAEAVAAVLNRIPGVHGAQVQAPAGVPQLVIRLVPDRLAAWGIAPTAAIEAVQAAYEGVVVGQVFRGNRSIPVVVVLNPENRKAITRVGSLLVRNPDGKLIPLSEIADIRLESGRYRILHSGGRRVQTVTANVVGRDAEQVESEARGRIATQVKFQPGNYVVFGGEARAQAAARADLVVHSLFAATGIAMLLYLTFRNVRNLMLTFLNLPFALLGGVIAVLALGGRMSLGSLVGFVTLFGISLRNSVMLVSHCQHLVEVEGRTWGAETALRAASDRLPAILMTALVTALALLPLALASGDAGREIEGPMAAVIVGGLFSSTVLNLVVLPTLLLRFGSFRPRAPEP